MGTGVAAGFADVEVAGVDMGCEGHAASTVGDFVLGICGNIVEQLVDGGGCGFDGSGLL